MASKQNKKAPLKKQPTTPAESNIAAQWVVYLETRPGRLFPVGCDIQNLEQAREYLKILWMMDKKWLDITEEYLKWPYPESSHIIYPILIEYYISYRNEQIGVQNNMPLFFSRCDDFGLICMLLGDNRGIIKAARACMPVHV